MASATPILDREEPLPKAARGSADAGMHPVFLVLLIGIAALVLAQFPVRRWLWSIFRQVNPRSGMEVAVFLAWAIAITFAAVAVHEVGHVIAGLATGFRFNGMAIGPLRIDRSFRLSLSGGTWTGGWASMLPESWINLRERVAVLVAAGPLSSIGAGAIAIALSNRWQAQIFAIASIIGGVSELTPFRTRRVAFDGWRLWMLARSDAWCQRSVALMSLLGELVSGTWPENLSRSDLARATALRDDSADTVSAHAFAYSNAFHQRRNDDAAQFLETCLRYSAYAIPLMREALMCDAAVFQARRRGRPEVSQQWLESIRTPGFRARVEAAILEANGNAAGALAKLGEVKPQSEVESRLLQRWRSELESLQSAT